VLVVRLRGLGRSSAVGLVVEACLVRCKAGRLLVVGLEEGLEVDLGMGSQLVAFGLHKEAVAGAVEVVDMTIGGDAWGIEADGSVVVETWKTQEELRSLVWL
jgi:hypothetical protein